MGKHPFLLADWSGPIEVAREFQFRFDGVMFGITPAAARRGNNGPRKVIKEFGLNKVLPMSASPLQPSVNQKV